MMESDHPDVDGPWRVLIADDDASFRRVVRVLLEDDPDFEVVGEAADGGEAVELAEQLQPDSVILDWRMPVMDGDAEPGPGSDRAGPPIGPERPFCSSVPVPQLADAATPTPGQPSQIR